MNSIDDVSQNAFESVSPNENDGLSNADNQNPEQMTHLKMVRAKLKNYVAQYTSAKDRRCLENHAHCFIMLS